MNDLPCSVVKDLIPSYIDQVCSLESKELVEKHISKCSDCKKLVTLMKTTEITSEQVQIKELNYMKKVKKHFDTKSLVSFILLFGFIVAGLIILISNYGDVPLNLYYIIGPVLIVASYYLFSDSDKKDISTKHKIIINIIGSVLICYTIMLGIICLKWGKIGHGPFNMPLEKLGPFVSHQLYMIGFIHTAFFIGLIIQGMRKSKINNVTMNIQIAGGCIAFAFISIFKRLTSIDTFITIRNRTIILILLEAVILSCIAYLLEKKHRQQKAE